MVSKAPFIHKFLKRLERVDREAIKHYVLDLAATNAVYEEIFDQLQEGVMMLSPEGRLLFANRQAAVWLGLRLPLESQPRFQEVFHDSLFVEFLSQHLPGLNRTQVSDVELLSPREVRLRIFLHPLRNARPKEILVLLSNLAGPQPGADEESWNRIKALIRLAAGIAHEIGNPLNAIGIHLQLLKKEVGALPAAKRKSFEKTLDVLNAETTRLDKIVRNFLKATRKSPLQFRAEDVNTILEEALEFMRPELASHGIRIDFQPDRSLPLFLMDRERLTQAFLNLIKNAMEAMPRGGTLSVRTSRQNRIAAIRFKDEGSGIPEADLPHIFEAYFTTKEEGSGLGLVTVFHAIRDHGGRIEVASKIGHGTTMTVMLPIRQPKLQLPNYKTKS